MCSRLGGWKEDKEEEDFILLMPFIYSSAI